MIAFLRSIAQCGMPTRLQTYSRLHPSSSFNKVLVPRLYGRAIGSCSIISKGSSLRNENTTRTSITPRTVARKVGRFRYIQTWSSISPRELAALEDHLVTHVGSSVKDPILKTDLRSLGWVQRRIMVSEQGLRIQLRLPTLLHPSLDELKEKVRAAVESELEKMSAEKGWESPPPVEVYLTTTKPHPVVAREVEEHTDLISRLGPGLSNISHFIAVYSCKGGVGKSTVAVILAYELAHLGGRIGLLDVDIYGPSLPVLVRPSDPAVRPSPIGRGMVLPIEHGGVKLMSLGYVSPDSGVPGSGPNGGAAVMRGPMAGKVVSQLLKGTNWGDLDVMILDLPPGTGDVQLEVCQTLELSGAVSVTTPSKMASTDARKGIEMFTSLGVQTLAAVENMAYFDCEGSGRHYPFGKGIQDLSNLEDNSLDFKSSNIFQLPISTRTNHANDSGSPLCLSRPDEAKEEISVFTDLARSVSKELMLLQHGRSSEDSASLAASCTVSFEGDTEAFDVASIHLTVDNAHETFTVRLFSEKGATQMTVPAKALRDSNPKTGENMDAVPDKSDPEEQECASDGMVHHHNHHHGPSKPSNLFPVTIDKKGRYGYQVEWRDGATIIYSMLSIAKAAGGLVKS